MIKREERQQKRRTKMKSNHGALSNIDGLQKENHCRKSLRINGKYSKRRKKCIENTFK